ncbi:MAG: LptF/LptG family permease [Chlamydiia bacterium]|nr:LptF/LptG family permease [Chlamydiia bacterium]
MLPLVWCYLLRSYFKVFFLSVFAFIAVLIVSRFKEIARFAALCGNGFTTATFTLYQIPLILPLAIPMSALLAAFLLFQGLSQRCELTALRSSGWSLPSLLSPILLSALFLSLANFSLCSSLTPYCRRETKKLLYQETSSNPLLLLQRQNLVKIRGAYLNLSVKKGGQLAEDVSLIAYNGSSKRLGLFSAQKLYIAGDMLKGKSIAFLSYSHAPDPDLFDPLLLENQTSMSTAAPVLSSALKKHRPKLDPSALNLKMLRLRMQGSAPQRLGALSEILRRLFLSGAVCTFTLLGCAFGIQQARTVSRQSLFYVSSLVLGTLMAYLGLKALKLHPLLLWTTAILPHSLIFMLSIHRFRALSQGTR